MKESTAVCIREHAVLPTHPSFHSVLTGLLCKDLLSRGIAGHHNQKVICRGVPCHFIILLGLLVLLQLLVVERSGVLQLFLGRSCSVVPSALARGQYIGS